MTAANHNAIDPKANDLVRQAIAYDDHRELLAILRDSRRRRRTL